MASTSDKIVVLTLFTAIHNSRDRHAKINRGGDLLSAIELSERLDKELNKRRGRQ